MTCLKTRTIMMIKKILIVCSLIVPLALNAQEQLIDLYGNPVLQKRSLLSFEQKSVQENDTLEVPFFDDFAVITMYPDQNKWVGRDVFVNDMWGMNPVSYGVASFDMADSIGNIRALSTAGEISDILTSRPLNLEYDIADSVYLSFAVQRGGFSRKPEEQDSLVLQFSSPDTVWHSVWNMAGGESDTAFLYFLVPVQDENLLVKGFRFRFLNYASNVANAPEPSFNSNNDIWNLDYVWLDTARSINDTIINDIAMMYNFESLIEGYESVPWKHYLASSGGAKTDSLTFIYRSNGENEQGVNRQFIISDVWGNGDDFSLLDDNENIHEFEIISYTKPVPYEFDSDQADSARFEIKGFIETDEEPERLPFRWNDTVYYYQQFDNYYAYDDGIPEAGYGIGGVGTNSASLAYRFEPLTGDTLRGVKMYFNKVLNEENIHYFYLMVWEDNEGLPGDTLAKQIGVRPEYKDSLFQYTYYALDTPVYISDAFHIGWTKTTDDMLNIGFDRNRDASENLNINLFGYWQSSNLAGALMIRPVFSENPVSGVSESQLDNHPEIDLYPNPATDRIRISTSVEYDHVKIVNAYGQIVLEYYDTGVLSLSGLRSGIYVVMLYKDGGIVGSRKLLIRP